MPVEIVMPKLGLTMDAGTIGRWLKAPGETVREGEPLLEVSTDKITYEVASPASGILSDARGGEGDEFACGAVLGTIGVAGEAAEAPPANDFRAAEHSVQPLESPRVVAPVHLANAGGNGTRVVASPAARKLARESGVSLQGLRGSGPHGRITLHDVTAKARASSGAPASARDEFPPRLPPARRAIYKKMTEVGRLPLAQVETTAWVDALAALIRANGDIGWTAFAVYAAARLLLDHAELRTDASTGAPFERISIGIAADTPHGLIVPVVRDAERRTLADVQREIGRLAAAARAGSLSPDDVGSAAFSISNVGPQRVERVAPLPDPPQTAILGLGAVTQRPSVAASGQIVAAHAMMCVLTFDHRFVDGAPAARFLAAFAASCADPGRFL